MVMQVPQKHLFPHLRRQEPQFVSTVSTSASESPVRRSNKQRGELVRVYFRCDRGDGLPQADPDPDS